MSHRTLLATVSGNDRPGVTRALFTALAEYPVTVDDIEQLVIDGRLVLSFLISLDDDVAGSDDIDVEAIRSRMRTEAAAVNMDITTVVGAAVDDARRRDRVHVTVLGAPLAPSSVAAVAAHIADLGGNIDRIRRIASYPVTAIVFEGSGVDAHRLARVLAANAHEIGADTSVREAGIDAKGQHLVVMDVDSTVIQDEVIDLLADEAGVMAQVAEITERAMAGELDFGESLQARVALLKGLPVDVIDRVIARVRLTPGARTLCRTLTGLGYRVCLVSGGFVEVVGPLAAELGVTDVRANALEVIDGVLSGRTTGPIIDRAGKRLALESFAHEYGIPMRRTIAIGDGANDVDMLEAAGLGVAFNGKKAARDAADASVSVPYLDSVLFLLGITREEIEAADADRAEVTREG